VSWSSGLDPRLRPYFEQLVAIAVRLDGTTRVTSARRSNAEQTRLYRRWLAGLSQYPVARPGTSKHQLGRAVDIVASPATLRRLGAIWERAGGRWGGRFHDDIHFEA